jgi:hypothetical protein
MSLCFFAPLCDHSKHARVIGKSHAKKSTPKVGSAKQARAYFASFFSLKNRKKITTMTAAKSAGHSQM